MPRCPSCNKFSGLEGADPEADDLEFNLDSLSITGTVRVYQTTACCGEEAREMTFDLEVEVDEAEVAKVSDGDGPNLADERIEWSVEIDGLETTEREERQQRRGRSVKERMVGYRGVLTLSAKVPEEYRQHTKDGWMVIAVCDVNDDAPLSDFDDLT